MIEPMVRQVRGPGDRMPQITRRMLLGVGAATIGAGGIVAAITRPGRGPKPGSLYWATAAPLGVSAMAVMEGDLWVGNGLHLQRWPVQSDMAEWEVTEIVEPVNAVACDSAMLVAGLGNSPDRGEVLRINPLNGVQMWRYDSDAPVLALALCGESVLAGAGGGGVNRRGGGVLHFLGARDGSQQAASVKLEGAVTSVAASPHGWLAGGFDGPADSHGSLSAWSPSGSQMWNQLLPAPVVAVDSVGGLAVCGSNGSSGGIVEAFDASTGARSWGPFNVGTPVGALLATSNGTLIVGTQTHLKALAVADGTVKWTFATPRQVFALAANSRFVFASTGNGILGLWL